MLKRYFIPIIGLVILLSAFIIPVTAITPGDFSITNPSFGEAIDASEKVKVTWSNADGADGYKIALRDLTTNEKLLNNEDIGNKRSYSIWLEHDHSYRVAICAYANTGEETWQECEFFTIPEQIDKTPEIISVSASPSSAPAGSEFTFTVKANEYTEEVTIEIDGYSIGTTSSYTTKNGQRIFTIEKELTSPGNNREVIAYALENGRAVSEEYCKITVTESEPAGVPTITSHDSGDKHVVGESLTVSWSAPSTNPDSYNVYLYQNGQVMFSKQSISAKKVTIPGSAFSKEGTYSIEVYAIKTGYKSDSPANVFITVEKKAEPVVETQTPATPQETVKPSEPLQPVVSPEIYSICSSPSSGTVDTEFIFTVTANNDVKKVGVEVGGKLIGTTTSYSKKNDKHVFTVSTELTITGKNQNVVAYAYDGNKKLSQVSSSTRITVTDNPSIETPTQTIPQEQPVSPTVTPQETQTNQPVIDDDKTDIPSGTINTQLGSQVIVSKNPKINEVKVNMYNGIFGFMCQGDYTVVVKTNRDVDKIMIKITGKTSEIIVNKYEDKWWFGDYREFTWKPKSNSQRWLFEGNTYTIDVYAYEGNSVLLNTKYSKNIKGTQPNNVGRVMGTI